MKRVAILGSDSTHTEVYAGLAAGGLFRNELSIHAIWGRDRSETESKAQALGIAFVARTPEEAVEKADGVFVLSRFSEDRADLGRVALRAGLPVFIDKCISEVPDEAREVVELAAAHRVALMSCSPYRFAEPVERARAAHQRDDVAFAVMIGPRECNDLGGDPRFREIGFYGIHSVESLVEALGPGLELIHCEASRMGTFASVRSKKGVVCTIALLSALPGELYRLTVAGARSIDDMEFSYDADTIYPASLRAILDQLFDGVERVPSASSLESVRLLAGMGACS